MIPSRPLFLGDIIGNTFVIAFRTWTRAAVAALLFMIVPGAVILMTAQGFISTMEIALGREGYLAPEKIEAFRERVVKQLSDDNPAFLEIYGIRYEPTVGEPTVTDAQFDFDLAEFFSKYSSDFSPFILLGVLSYILLIIATLAYQITSVDLASREFEERKLDLGKAMRDALSRHVWINIIQFLILIFVLAFGLGVVIQISSFLTPAVGALLVLAAAIMTIVSALRLLFAQPALVSETLGPVAALRRSWEISKGSSWRVFGIFIVFALVVIGVYVVLSIPFAAITSSSTNVVFNFLRGTTVSAAQIFDSLRGFATEIVVSMVITTAVFASLGPSFLTVFYYDLRTRKDGPLTYDETEPVTT